jgi:hippurate hydrolase
VTGGTFARAGGTGVVGVLSNGGGPTVLLRAELDALPVREDTGADYASAVTVRDADGHEVPVAHACGRPLTVTGPQTGRSCRPSKGNGD